MQAGPAMQQTHRHPDTARTSEGLSTVVEVVHKILSQLRQGAGKVSTVAERPNVGCCWLRQAKRPIPAEHHKASASMVQRNTTQEQVCIVVV
jgi:hypothetical protein